MTLLYEDLTRKILEACFEVSDELGAGFLESVYHKSLIIALRQKSLQVCSNVPISVMFRGPLIPFIPFIPVAITLLDESR